MLTYADVCRSVSFDSYAEPDAETWCSATNRMRLLHPHAKGAHKKKT
jgi:hypothetical protein